jgi:PAS domain S-box-containing protein
VFTGMIGTLLDLAAHFALLSVVTVAYSLMAGRLARLAPWYSGLLAGGLFGLAAIFVMSAPIRIADGAFFDLRGVILALSAPFGGPVAAVIAALMAGSFRIWLGGAGVAAGIANTVLASLIGGGLALALQRSNRKMEHRHLVLLAALMAIESLVPLAFLPSQFLQKAIELSVVPLLIGVPLGTLLLGSLLLHERRRREIEQALDEASLHLRTIAANAPIVINQRRMTPDGTISYPYLNGRVLEIFGVTTEDTIANPALVLDNIQPEDREGFWQSLLRSRNTLSAWSHEYRIVGRDGRTKWLHGRGTPRRLENGDVIWDGIMTEVTARKEAERALQASEARYRFLADHSTDMISRISLEGIRLYASPAAKRLLGYPPEELVGRSIFEINHPDDADRSREAIEALASGAAEREVTVRFIRKDGTTVWVESRMSTVTDPETGRPREILTVVRDISRRKALEEQFAGTSRLLRGVLENMTQGLCVFDRDLRLVLCNQNYLDMLDYPSRLGVPGTHFSDIIRFRHERGDYGDARMEDIIADRLSYQHPGCTAVDEITGPDGSIVRADLSTDDSGMMIGTLTDITQLKRHEVAIEQSRARLTALADDLAAAKRRAEDASKAKSHFLANMTHELRTPLNAIIGFSDLIRSELYGPVGDKRYGEYAGVVRDSGQHLLELINDILDFSKIEAGELPLHEEITNISDLVDSCVRMLLVRAAHGNLSVQRQLQSGLPDLRCDVRRVRQIVLNLLSNAIKYTPAGGEIRVSTGLDRAGNMEIAVSDTGVGIADQDQRRVMEAFVQVDSDLNRKSEGTGLGLPLTKRLVELHGASLTLRSKLGEGTTMTVRFPRERVIWPAETTAASA